VTTEAERNGLFIRFELPAPAAASAQGFHAGEFQAS